MNSQGRVEGKGRSSLVGLILGLSPVWLGVFLAFAAPTFIEPFGRQDVAIAGLPLGVVLSVVSLVLAVSGAIVIWKARSTTVVAAALVLLTFPALMLVLMGPAVILILENLGGS